MVQQELKVTHLQNTVIPQIVSVLLHKRVTPPGSTEPALQAKDAQEELPTNLDPMVIHEVDATPIIVPSYTVLMLSQEVVFIAIEIEEELEVPEECDLNSLAFVAYQPISHANNDLILSHQQHRHDGRKKFLDSKPIHTSQVINTEEIF